MPDRMQAQIEIGGQISRGRQDSLLDYLIGELITEGVQSEYGGPDVITIADEAALLEFLNDSGYLQFRHDEKTDGEFEELEDWLREHGIPYRRWSEPKYEHPGENVYWNPGMMQPLVLYCDGDTREVVLGEKVREALAKLEKGGQPGVARLTEAKLTDEAMRILNMLCPTIPDAMPKFEIIS